MSGTRKSAARNSYVLAAVQPMELRRLLSAAVASVPADWVAEPTFMLANSSVNRSNGVLTVDIGSAAATGYTPTQIRGAYGVDQISFAGITGDGTGQTIAIVDAYDDPSAQADLKAFDNNFGLTAPPSFEILNEDGQASPLPGVDPSGPGSAKSWESEESLDIEWAHVIAPGANIILFEASTSQSLYTAVSAARVTPGVDVVSMSWGGTEFAGETALDSTIFSTPAGSEGITFVASAGDNGKFDVNQNTVAPAYPAASPNVLTVGGTTLLIDGTTYAGESGWGNGANSWSDGGGGGGISQFEAQPSYQNGNVNGTSATQRVYPDVAMEADPNTGVPIYDSYDFGATTPWAQIGGTSLAAPMWAGLIAIADQGRTDSGLGSLDGRQQTLPDLYQLPSADFHDIITGNNGYAAGVGYDLVTGLGSPVANTLVPDLVNGQSITGIVWNDANSDGILDNNETGINNVTVELVDPGLDGVAGGTDDSIVKTTLTLSDGTYGFFVTQGTYYVQVIRPSGYFFTAENVPGSAQDSNVDSVGQSAVFTVSQFHPNETINAGMVPTGIEIDGVVFNDSDVNPTTYLPNGIYDNGESGPAGAVVKLYSSGGTLLDTKTTGNGGGFDFIALDAGSYYIVVTAPTNYLFTLQDQGTDPTRESIVDQTTGVSPTITLAVNQKDLHANAGVYLPRIYVTPATAVTGRLGQTVPMQFPAQLYVFPGQATSNPITITYDTEDQSAIAGVDYEQTFGMSEIDPGQTHPGVLPTVNLIGTDVISPDKVFFLNLSAADGDGNPTAEIVDPTASGTIVNHVPDAITVDASRARVTETPAGVVAYFTVQLATPVDAAVLIDYTLGAPGDTATGATPAEIEDGTVKLAAVDYLASSLSGTLTFPAGTVTETIPVLVLDNFGMGTGFNVINTVDKTFTLTLTDATDPGSDTALTLATPTGVGHIADDPVQNLNIGGTGTTYVDNSGNTVSIVLNGPGSAVVQKRGGENSDGIRIVLTGTTSASQLNISSKGQTTINEIDDDSPLGSINGSKVNLTGSMALDGGLGKLTLNSITPTNLITIPGIALAPGVQITIGGGPLGSIITLNAKVGRVTDTTFDSGIPISSMKVASFNNQNGQPSRVFAPTIGNLTVAGNFQENVQTNSIKKLAVGGTIQNSSIRAAISIGPVTAGSLLNSQIFAGVLSSGSSLPTSDTAFTPGSSIKSVNLRGKNAVFSNSSIAAAIVGPLNLGHVQPEANVPYFGVAGLELLSVRGSTGTLFSIPKETADLGTVFSDEDFLIQVYGI